MDLVITIGAILVGIHIGVLIMSLLAIARQKKESIVFWNCINEMNEPVDTIAAIANSRGDRETLQAINIVRASVSRLASSRGAW